jgi:hypothetical protein
MESDGLIHQGPYLICADEEGMIHILYEGRPLIHGMGIFCGLDGYTTPKDFAEKKLVRQPGRVEQTFKARGSDIRFRTALRVEGERIRISVLRTSDWPENVWGSYRITLPVRVYKGSGFRVDESVHTFPLDYDAAYQFPATNETLALHETVPELNLVLESSVAISIQDMRKFKSPTYAVNMSLPRGTQNEMDIFLTLPDVPGSEQPAAVRWSHIGYPLSGEKFVTLEWSRYEDRPVDKVHLENRVGEVLKDGRFGKTLPGDYIQGSYAEFDFSEISVPGEYRVVWSGGATDWFPIRQHVFSDALWEPTLDYFIPYEMCHARVDLGEQSEGHDLCHHDDALLAPAHHRGPDGFTSYEAGNSSPASPKHVKLNVGGWHDAGDHDLNVPAQAFTVWTLALAHEEFNVARDVASLDRANHVFTTAKADGEADIVQQITWGVLWLLSVQREDGSVFNGVCAENDQRSGRPLGKLTDGISGNKDDRLLYPDYHADQQLNYAIALAAASRVLARQDEELGQQCLNAAQRAFDYFQKHEQVYRPGSYTAASEKKGESEGSTIAAAIELFLTTREQQYMETVQSLAPAIADLKLDWPYTRQTSTGSFRYVPPFLARILHHLPEGDTRTILEGVCRRAISKKIEQTSPRPWPFKTYHFGQWGNSYTSTSRAFDTYWLHKAFPDELPAQTPLRNMLWIFGLHPTCDTVLVCGLIDAGPQHHYSLDLHAKYGDAPKYIPGAVIPGMGGFWYSGVISHIDEYGYYGHNEACIYTQAQYIFAIKAMQSMGF